MPIYELAIAVKDEPEAHRKNQGDIIAIKPYPWYWGRKEIDEYFIVLLRADKTPEQIRKVNEGVYQRMDTEELITETVANMLENELNISVKLVDKNRFRISLTSLKQLLTDLDTARFEDKKCIYQPCKTLENIKRYYQDLKDEDVHVVSALAATDEEFVIDLQGELVWDKLKKVWVN